MCIVSNTLFPKKAKEDIIYYKLLDSNMKSPFMDFQYDFKLYKAKGIEFIIIDIIKSLFRKIKIIPVVYNCKCKFSWFGTDRYSKGLLHSYKTYEWAITELEFSRSLYRKKYFVYKAIIPKGTYYYEGYSDIASRKLQIIEKLN